MYIAAALFLGIGLGWAQNANAPVETQAEKELKTWYHKNYQKDQVFGVNTDAAYQFFESKGLKPNYVVVGVLDSGVEVDHPGLVKNMWVNSKEIPGNGIDDDKNGYVDDIHGWNFLGNKKGDVDVDNMEVTRIVKKYQPIFEGSDSAKNKANQLKMPDEFQAYMDSKQIFSKKSIEARQNYAFFQKMSTLVPTMVRMIEGKNLTMDVLKGLRPTTQDEAISLDFLGRLYTDPEVQGKSSEKVKEYLDKLMKDALKQYGTSALYQYNLDFDPRSEFVGDDYDNYNEKHYGNNHYEGPDAQHGTHVAGIIAGYPQGTEPQYGVASKVAKIMSVRVVPDGDERDKDIANAIRYAVDNGAKILNMSFGKPMSPGKKYVWDAFKYAQDKGVLLVKAAGNENEDIAIHRYYPTNFTTATDPTPFINNMIVVGASTNDNNNLRADFSNYNQKMVNVFAPGDKIYSTVPDGKYEYLQGTSMASPVVAGAAAVLLAYMPNLKPHQIIEGLVRTSNKSTVSAQLTAPDNARFDSISEAGGVIDVAKAAQYLYEKYGSSVKSVPKKITPVKKAVKK